MVLRMGLVSQIEALIYLTASFLADGVSWDVMSSCINKISSQPICHHQSVLFCTAVSYVCHVKGCSRRQTRDEGYPINVKEVLR